ncbi:MAG: ABC transporter permease [Holophagaceae bacterium]|nr:ABC transporter permease [Holophagaceae bacterium]
MNKQIDSFKHAILAEWIKGRRTFLRLSPIVFAIIPILIPTAIFFRDFIHTERAIEYIQNMGIEYDPILSFSKLCFRFWVFFVLPVYCIFFAILNYQTEHTQGLWKHINAQPISGTTQAMAKQVYAWCYITFTTLLLFALVVAISLFVKFYNPPLGLSLNSAPFWIQSFQHSIVSIAHGMIIVSILNFFAARFSGATVPIMVGSIGCMLPIAYEPTYSMAPYIPWLYNVVLLELGSFSPAWVAIPVIHIATALAIHFVWQKDAPLY